MQWSEKRPKNLDANIKQAGRSWLVRVKLKLPDGSIFESEATAPTKVLARKDRDDIFAAYNNQAFAILSGERDAERERAANKMSLGELAVKCRDEWWPAKGRSVDISEQFFQKVRDYVYPVLGEDLDITTIVPAHWDRVLAHLLEIRYGDDKPLSESTIRKVKATLSSALSCAVTNKRLMVNPIKGLPYNPHPLTVADRLGKDVEELADGDDAPAKRMLSDEEVQKLIRAANGSLIYPLVVLQLGFGLRIGEALAVKWSDFDWSSNEVRVRFQAKRRRNPEWAEGSKVPRTVLQRVRLLKSRAGKRDIYLFADAEALLKTLPRGVDGAYVCPSDVEGLMDPRNAQRAFNELLAKLELDGEKPTTHSMRSWRLSNWANVVGLPVSQLQRLAGHTRVETTMRYYVRSDRASLVTWLDSRGEVSSALSG
jgi:integrase